MATTRPASLSLDAYRSPADHKRYRVVTLPNGLEALLVQNDPFSTTASPELEPELEPVPSNPRARRYSFFSAASETSDNSDDESDNDDRTDHDDESDAAPANTHHAAACLTVGVGSMADPPNVRGLAHYLEHMLFMGSEKYPDENAFEAFLATHGGYSNGATECESTRFLFEVGARHLQPALDMFAQFFLAPLFKPEALERELLAIESEFNRARQNDYVRLQQVQCETCTPGHAYDSFSWGNRASLETVPTANGIDVRDAMIAFYRRYYTPSVMKLCVYGEDSLDDMEQWVLDSFGEIPCAPPTGEDDKRDSVVDSEQSTVPFGVAVGQEPALLKVVPVHKMHIMHVYWQLPPLLTSYNQKPWEYLSHALGHEGDGSITAVLKQRGWGSYVTVGISESDGYEFGSFGSLFEVGITLTRAGVAHWNDVVHVIFDALTFVAMQPSGMQPWIFDELKTSTEMAFLFQEQLEPVNVCRRMSHLLQTRHGVDRRDLLRYDVIQGEFDEPQTRKILAYMTPQNTRVVVLSHLFADEHETEWRVERWFGAKYSLSLIPSAVLEQWRTPSGQYELRDPCRNPFMPTNFDIVPHTDAGSNDHSCDTGDSGSSGKRASAPGLVHTTHLTKLWYKQDDAFFVPKTNANFLLCLPAITRSVADYVCARIYVKIVNDALKQVHYQANNANLGFELAIRDLDLEVTFASFSDSLSDLVRVVFQTLVDAPILPATFTIMRDELVREYRNVNLKPSMKARYLRLQLLERTSFSIEDKIRSLADVHLTDVAHFRDAVMWRDGDVTVRSLVHGNCTRGDAVALQLSVESILSARMLQASSSETPMPPKTPTRPHTTELPLTTNGILLRDMSEHDEETNSAVEVYYQIGKCGYAQHAYALLIDQLMQEPLFHDLRTIQQLGYEVSCCVRDTHGVLGFSIAVQSASHASSEIAVRIDHFVHDSFLHHLLELSAETFAAHVATLQRHKSRLDAHLQAETDRYWEEIQSRRLDFDADREIVAVLDQCTLPELIEYYKKWLFANSENDTGSGARKLRVHVVGKSSHFVPLEKLVREDEAPVVVKSLHEYKKMLTCHC